ncbi:MAG: ThiF family adenylyltransferase [Bacteroidaceae bacterium]|nr:ThiF family adenylyltransferase [Bacteroidaceae bacterium]
MVNGQWSFERSTRVMVVGCGALGNEVLKNLTLMGVQHIVAVDFDHVEIGNLTRSVLFRKGDALAGRYKTDVIAERLRELNPQIDIKPIIGNIAYDVGLGLVRQMDVVIGCVDSQWARFCINRLCMRAGVPWVDGGISELEGTARVFVPGVNCYACNMGSEGLKDLKRRMPCSGIIRRHEEAGSVPTTSLIASIIGAVQVQEALKLVQAEALADGSIESLCGKMFYYEGEHLTNRLVEFKAWDEDCAEHERWEPVVQTGVHLSMTVSEALSILRNELAAQEVEISLRNDCFVDFVMERATDSQWEVMLPGRAVEDFVMQHERLGGIPLSGLYQHELRRIGNRFPYQDLTLKALGLPGQDVLCVMADGTERFVEMK